MGTAVGLACASSTKGLRTCSTQSRDRSQRLARGSFFKLLGLACTCGTKSVSLGYGLATPEEKHRFPVLRKIHNYIINLIILDNET